MEKLIAADKSFFTWLGLLQYMFNFVKIYGNIF